MNLKYAHLYYGASHIKVKPHEGIPLPTEFDFSNPEECARKVFAIMSNASGGHALRNCRVKISHDLQSASLVAGGCHVYYTPAVEQPKKSLEEILRIEKNSITIQLGTVVTDQYGDGWKRANWLYEEA